MISECAFDAYGELIGATEQAQLDHEE